MPDPPDKAITQVLEAAQAGDPKASEVLLPLVYDALRRLARARMSKTPPGQTLEPTALVHEAYLRLVGDVDPNWKGRGHFFAAAARAMRNILVDQARRKASPKHGGDRVRHDVDELGEVTPTIEPPVDDLPALDEAVKQLEAIDPRKGHIVNLRYFAGLTAEETAAAMDLSVSTVKREWAYCKRWLYTRMTDRPGQVGGPSGDA